MNVAFIPVRGGSKSIPLKNIREIAGKPLVYWVVKAASDCQDINVIYVATDSDMIKEVVESFGLNKVEVIGRSAYTASDTASTELAMLEFAEQYQFDNIILIQATSPLLTADDLSGGFMEFKRQNTDSVLSVVKQKRFCWVMDQEGFAKPDNYDIFHRPRRQEFDGYLVENGAFYITRRRNLLSSGNRISGNIRVYEMEESTYFEIDELSDWTIIERQLEARMKRERCIVPKIKMFLTDCDGCLTDGGMYYSETGDELKKFSTLDGLGFRILKEKGILTGIITGEKRVLNKRRAEKLKLDIYEEGISDKLATVKILCEKAGVELRNVAYVGDDINDLELIRTVGFGCSVANGIEEVKKAATYVSQKKGGQGAVREIIDMIVNCGS
jgi:YrbI family 3-deoxy-D-manno-octulosonate 8-phosphate phosphatase